MSNDAIRVTPVKTNTHMHTCEKFVAYYFAFYICAIF